MQCPVCDDRLRAIERHGVEIDICPSCKGVWLDRGELEKIVALEAGGGPAAQPDARPDDRRPREPRDDDRRRDERSYRRDDDDDDDDRREEHGRQQHDRQGRPVQKKRGSWFGEMFDMLGGGGDD